MNSEGRTISASFLVQRKETTMQIKKSDWLPKMEAKFLSKPIRETKYMEIVPKREYNQCCFVRRDKYSEYSMKWCGYTYQN